MVEPTRLLNRWRYSLMVGEHGTHVQVVSARFVRGLLRKQESRLKVP